MVHRNTRVLHRRSQLRNGPCGPAQGENDGEIVAVITSGADGTAETPLLTWGEYQIVETRVPDDYLDDGYSVTVRIPAEVKAEEPQTEETPDPVK